MLPHAVTLTLLIATTLALGACKSTDAPRSASPRYHTLADDLQRDTDRARQLNRQAVQMLEAGQVDEAESLLKQALGYDIMYGPAHNNLGKVYYAQQKFYLAAWEFQYAIKLMPDQPAPRNNLGLVMEAANRLEQAMDHYREAYDLAPDNYEIIGNLARAHVRRGDRDPHVRDLLEQVILKDQRPQWVQWAREQHARLPRENAP